MTGNDHSHPIQIGAASLVRPYVITNGRDLPDDSQFTLTTLVTAVAGRHEGQTQLSPEERHLLAICGGGYLSVAELAAHTRLPIGVVKILLSALAERGYLIARAPVPRAQLADPELLREVLHGLQAHFG
ncbi:DUF742 domain-containing protein [Streptomyces sp. NBC_01619]|uniref:DUF742 domain-containing protein n=1 Tax=Streptomyces sp. NBC_01619 TaxID=2975901 RepID=UPI00225044B0|nr:DUF742 domain-containing protein [Streptomyces sp. NBC_01619]MCX4515792.1 DUF742 domain-containing protein [Streptomyces sp. NBC_01619]